MKALSLKLEEDIFEDVEKITSELNIARNRYISKAVELYNKFYKKRLLKKKLAKASKLVAENSMDVLKEYEAIDFETLPNED